QLEIEEKQQTMVDLEEKIEAYRAEREKLDKITFVHLKAILTGSKDEKIYEKRNQITDAQYDYDEMQQAVSSIEVLIKGIQENIKKKTNKQKKKIKNDNKNKKIYEKRNQITDAQYDYDEMQQAVSSIEVLIKGIQENINALPDIDSDYENIMKQKETLIMDAHP